MGNLQIFGYLIVGIVALGLVVNLILVPMTTDVSEVTGGSFVSSNATSQNRTVALTPTSNKLYSDPIGYLFDFLNPLNVESLKTNNTDPAKVAVEIGEKVVGLGGFVIGLVAGAVTQSSGPPAAGTLTLFGVLAFKVVSDLSAVFALIPVVGTGIMVLLAITTLAVFAYVIAAIYSQAGG